MLNEVHMAQTLGRSPRRQTARSMLPTSEFGPLGAHVGAFVALRGVMAAGGGGGLVLRASCLAPEAKHPQCLRLNANSIPFIDVFQVVAPDTRSRLSRDPGLGQRFWVLGPC